MCVRTALTLTKTTYQHKRQFYDAKMIMVGEGAQSQTKSLQPTTALSIDDDSEW
ncbi:MAG: hypothetical protein MJE68_14200 [Proteobacteria bacterium]|nr:hypothetical protein [Pseudomonadota bacterium]